jgi:hypothetical protein
MAGLSPPASAVETPAGSVSVADDAFVCAIEGLSLVKGLLLIDLWA